MILHTKLSFQEHLKDKLSKISKTIRLQYMSSLLDPILTMATSYVTKYKIPHSIKA